MPYGFHDVSMTQGYKYQVGQRRRKGLFQLFDNTPTCEGGSITHEHIRSRKLWPGGMTGTQISWCAHGRIAILKLEDEREIALWCSELQEIQK
ncbi:hypothetical protein ACFOY8_12415 [Thalassospira xianhensis]|uniref:Uncharacterized protein n=1 Tax=Thalassospira xianhensis MCCC 1A02616 TaxID=1177929 RepID=A0A367UH02_9PROT|nr:hypothetical protein [Thalassospira xianhensis]RCK06332.1 hypothetical protein TH5_09020 [Thalassospira xianhensis MCCC 1A02616]